MIIHFNYDGYAFLLLHSHKRTCACMHAHNTHTHPRKYTYIHMHRAKTTTTKVTILPITCKVSSHIMRDSVLTHTLKWHDGERMLWYKVFTLCLLEKLYVHPDDQAQTHTFSFHTQWHTYNYTTIISIYIYGSSFESVFHNEQTESNILIWLICHVFITTISMPQILEFIHTTDTTI